MGTLVYQPVVKPALEDPGAMLRHGGLRIPHCGVRQRLGVPLTEDMIMPITRDLPESMPKAKFTRRFGGIGAPAYARMMAEFEGCIAAMPVYR
jgi:hypothetical protein